MSRISQVVQSLTLLSMLVAIPGLARADDEEEGGCPEGLERRSPMQVWSDHLAALNRGDMTSAFCDYAANAAVITPSGVFRGLAQIKTGFMALAGLFGGVNPTITSVSHEGEVVLQTFTLITSFASIPDGADTFVIREGHIQYQAVHATLSFAH